MRRGTQPVQYWEFKCECGARHITRAAQVKSGTIKSCGCLRQEKQTAPRAGKHKMIRTAEYRAWSLNAAQMSAQIRPPSSRRTRDRLFCDRWNEFKNFFSDMGPRPSEEHSLDRIDNNGNYEPANCRWATAKQQAVNRHNSIYVTVGGRDAAQRCSQSSRH